MKRFFTVIPTLLLCAMLLASCAGKQSDDTAPTGSVAVTTAGETDDGAILPATEGTEDPVPAETDDGGEDPGEENEPDDAYTKNY